MSDRCARYDSSDWTGKGKTCQLWEVAPCVKLSGRAEDPAQPCGHSFSIPRGECLVLTAPDREPLHAINFVSGVAKSYKTLPDGRRQIVGFHFPGDLLLQVPEGELRTPVLEAIIPTTLCRANSQLLQRIQAARPDLALRLLRGLALEQAAGADRMLRLGCMTAEARLASFLIEMQQRVGGRSGAENTIALPMGRQDIADYLGLKAETVSRTFTKLKRAGVLAMPRPNQIVIEDRTRLLELAAVDDHDSDAEAARDGWR